MSGNFSSAVEQRWEMEKNNPAYRDQLRRYRGIRSIYKHLDVNKLNGYKPESVIAHLRDLALSYDCPPDEATEAANYFYSNFLAANSSPWYSTKPTTYQLTNTQKLNDIISYVNRNDGDEKIRLGQEKAAKEKIDAYRSVGRRAQNHTERPGQWGEIDNNPPEVLDKQARNVNTNGVIQDPRFSNMYYN